jgi:O-antigen ligase
LKQLSRSDSGMGSYTETKPKLQNYIWLIAFLPFIQALMSWDFDGKLNGVQYAIRHLSIPAIMVEIIIVIIAHKNKLVIYDILKNLPFLIKLMVFMWILFATVASILPMKNNIISLISMSRYILHGFFFAALFHLFLNEKNLNKSNLLKAISIGMFSYISLLLIFCLTVPDPEKFDWVMRMPSATNIRQIANLIAIPAAAPIALLLFGKKSHKIQSTVIIFCIIMFIAWSGSRTALFAIVLSIFAALIFVRTIPKIMSLTLLITSIVMGLVTSLFLPIPSPAFGLLRIFDRMQDTGDLSSGRVQFWLDTITEIAKRPWGYGSGRFRNNMNELYGTDLNHPHNLVLQFTYDWGVFGAAAILTLLACLLLTIWKKAPSDPLTGFAAASGLLTLCAISMVDGAFFYPLTIIAAIILVTPILVDRDDNKNMIES